MNKFTYAQSILCTLSQDNLNHFKRDFGYSDQQIKDFQSSTAEVDEAFISNMKHFVEFIASPDNGVEQMQGDFLDMMGTNEYDATVAAYNVVDWDNKL